MQRDFGSGGLVFRNQDNKLEVLLIQNHKMTRPDEFWWGLPKGHIDKGETSEQAALREVKEETGISAEISEKVGDSKYIFTLNGEKVFKVVTIYLMKYLSGDAAPQQSEISKVEWVDAERALDQLSFANDKSLLKQALVLLDN
jgi:8-oxo-dGTP pyrophosphatase MutT (NUDIX family)